MSAMEARFCEDTATHGWHHWYRAGDGAGEPDLVQVRCEGFEPKSCPDGGTCHHACGVKGHTEGCFRVIFAGPLSGVYPDDRWPDDVRKENGAWLKFDTMAEVVEERMFEFVAEEYTECEHLSTVEGGQMVGRGNVWVCLDCVAQVATDEAVRLVIDKVEALAVRTEAEADKEGRDNPTLRTIKLVRAQGMRDVIKALKEETL